MSVRAMTWAAAQKAGSPTGKLVLVMLADFAGDDGESHYSNARLAVTCEMSVDTLQRHLTALEGMGLIARVATFRPDGSRSTNKVFCLYNEGAREAARRAGWRASTDESPGIEPPANCGPPSANSGGPHRTGAATPPQLCGGHKEPSENRKIISPLPPEAAREGGEGLCEDAEASSAPAQPSRWDSFKAAWPWQDGQSESVDAARRAFNRLTEADGDLCVKGAEAFQPRPGRVCAAVFISERHWAFTGRRQAKPAANVASGLAGTKATRKPDGTWFLAPGSPQLEAWHSYERARSPERRASPGCTRPSEWPPGHGLTATAAAGERREARA